VTSQPSWHSRPRLCRVVGLTAKVKSANDRGQIARTAGGGCATRRVAYQPVIMLDSITLRACSRSVPVSCM